MKKHRWNVKKFAANMTILVEFALIAIILVVFFGAPYLHITADEYRNTMLLLAEISIPVCALAITAQIIARR